VNVQSIVNLISHYGYLAVFVLMLAESACIPVPSEVIMMFGGALAAGAAGAGAGTPPALIGIVAAGVLGNVAGSYIAWAVGKYAGQAAVHRWGRRIGIREHEIDRSAAWFERHGPVAVLLGRVVPVIRTFISLPAGFAGMPAGRFGLYTTLGCIPWTAALGIAGYALGANWEHIANDFKGPTYAIAAILVIGVIAVIVLRRRRGSKAQPPAQGQYGQQPAQGQYGYGQPPAPSQYPQATPGDWRPADPRQPVGRAADRAGWTRTDAQPGGYQWEPPAEHEQQYR
jgi:membrane protein DedA with SNARE-associated domain